VAGRGLRAPGIRVCPTGHRQTLRRNGPRRLPGGVTFFPHEVKHRRPSKAPCQESGFSTRHANDAMMAMGSEAIFAWVFGVAAS
jgi:hypothetical protein